MVRNEYQGLPVQLGRGRLGSTRPSDDVTYGSGTNQTSGPLSSLSPQTKEVELECDNLGYCSKVDSISVSSILWRFAAISPYIADSHYRVCFGTVWHLQGLQKS